MTPPYHPYHLLSTSKYTDISHGIRVWHTNLHLVVFYDKRKQIYIHTHIYIYIFIHIPYVDPPDITTYDNISQLPEVKPPGKPAGSLPAALRVGPVAVEAVYYMESGASVMIRGH